MFAIDIPNPFHLVPDAIRDALLAPLNALTNAIADALTAVMKTLSTAWIHLGTPNVATSGGHATPVVAFLQSELAPYVGVLLAVSLLIGAIRIMLSRQARHVGDVMRGLFTYVIVAGVGTAAMGLLITAADQFSESIIDHASAGNQFGKNLELLMGVTGLGSVFMVMTLGVIAILVSLIQISLVIARAGLLVLFVGLLPLAASMAITETGRVWLRKYVGWALSFILYKPVAAIIYAAAFKLIASDVFHSDGILRAIVGISLMGLAIVALPALLRLLVPATSHLATGGGAAMAGTAAVVGSMPTGARDVAPMVRPQTVAQGPTGAAGASAAGAAAGGVATVTALKTVHTHAQSAAHRAMGHQQDGDDHGA